MYGLDSDALKPERFSDLIQIRVQPRIPAMVAAVADRKCTTASEYVRRAIINQLEFDGVDVSTGQHVAIGLTLHLDQPAPEAQQFALVDGDSVYADSVITGLPEGDKRTWLPVVNADAQPFDARTHYREKPYLKRDGDRVLRIYPIRNKADSFHAGDL